MVIPGQVSIDTSYYAVKLTSIDSSNTLAHFTTGTILTGGTSGVTAEITKTVATDGTDPDTIFVKYSKTGTDNAKSVFDAGETLTSDGTGNPTVVVDTTHEGSAAAIQSGVYYINGFFVQVAASTLILDKYTNTPSYRIGLSVTESFVTPSGDPTLNDRAQGVSNTNAPGAHRFKTVSYTHLPLPTINSK